MIKDLPGIHIGQNCLSRVWRCLSMLIDQFISYTSKENIHSNIVLATQLSFPLKWDTIRPITLIYLVVQISEQNYQGENIETLTVNQFSTYPKAYTGVLSKPMSGGGEKTPCQSKEATALRRRLGQG